MAIRAFCNSPSRFHSDGFDLKKTYDAIVVGSGAAGGMAAKELTEGGLQVLLLEAGPRLDPARDFHTHSWPYEMPFRGFDRPGDRQKLYPNQIYTDEYTRALYIEDPQHPYTTPPDQPYTWVRSRCVGGKILHWSRNARRLSNFDFKAAERDGYGENWPITYEELAPFYDKVESFHRRSRLDREHPAPSGWQVSAAVRR